MERTSSHKMTLYLSLAHMCVDFLCIFTLFHYFSEDAFTFMLYNFFAFALQLPLGLVIDIAIARSGNETKLPLLYTVFGMGLCIAGCFGIYWLSGLGNALFHSGGGVLAIREDRVCESGGQRLGIFVAPGAFGVSAGILLGTGSAFASLAACTGLCMILLSVLLIHENRKDHAERVFLLQKKPEFLISALCMAAVVLRSFSGVSLVYDWTKTTVLIILLTVMTAGGKAGGGILSARIGRKKTEALSLGLSALFYLFSRHPLGALAAVFFFNMSMPLTLQMESENHFDMPGFAFGLLTFGLFLGSLPQYCGLVHGLSAHIWGPVLSLVTLGLLLLAERKKDA